MAYWLVILVGLIGGAAVGIQSPIAGAMATPHIDTSRVLGVIALLISGYLIAR